MAGRSPEAAGSSKFMIPVTMASRQALTQVAGQPVHIPARLRRHVDVLRGIVLQIEQNRTGRFRGRAPIVWIVGAGLWIEATDQLIAAVVYHPPAPQAASNHVAMFPCLTFEQGL